jgi:hypothetical protein
MIAIVVIGTDDDAVPVPKLFLQLSVNLVSEIG